MASTEIEFPGATAVPPSWTDRTASTSLEGWRFYYVFLTCLALISLPVKNLAYVVPPLYLFIELLASNRSAWRAVQLAAICAIVSIVSLMIDAFRGQTVNVPGLFIALVTSLPLFLFFGARHDKRVSDWYFNKLIEVSAWFVIVQSLVGFVQFALSRNGDAVAGTFGLLDFYLNTISISQVYFTFALFGMMLFLMLDAKRPLVRVAIVLGLIACAIAQSGHQTVFFVASMALCSMIQLRRFRTAIRGTALVVFLTVIVMQLYPETWVLTRDWFHKVVVNPRSAKRMVISDSAQILASPKNAFLGVGMGQYSSRGALITSNEYLSRKIPGILSAKSDYFAGSMVPAIHSFDEFGEGSAISKPYFSMLTVLVELGPVLALVCLGGFSVHFWRNFQWMHSRSPEVARIGMVSCVGLLFFLLCCGIENYIEFPQAIFLPLLLYLAAQARASQLTAQTEE